MTEWRYGGFDTLFEAVLYACWYYGIRSVRCMPADPGIVVLLDGVPDLAARAVHRRVQACQPSVGWWPQIAVLPWKEAPKT